MNKNIILVTGASSDIGSAIIRSIANDETIILAQYNRNIEQLMTLKREVSGVIIPMQADFNDESSILSLTDKISTCWESPGKIIHMAAPCLTMVRFKDIAWEDFRVHLEGPLRAAVSLLNRFLPKMAKSGYGRVVFMLSSVTLGVPPSSMAHYVTAKYALMGLMKAAASEYSGKGVTINAIAPSMVETKFLKEIPEKLIELAAQGHPLKRNATPEDIAPLVKYILSDEAGYITGATIPITGGLLF